MRRIFLTVCLLLCGVSAQAQPAIDGELLGVGEAALKGLFPDIQRLAKPVMGPHRIKGTWRLAHTPLADMSLETTFFVSAHHVVRIEQQALLEQSGCPASTPDTALLAELQTKYGSGVDANNTDASGNAQRSVAWVNQGANVLLYLTQESMQCDVLLVYQPHVENDGSEL
ncbi:hypothetical protein [Rhodoferax sp.]|uniref:hypothetical protein n=1 Tax=Rhodoferax sp. TaxID=50421 RepID=UPI00283DA3DE|nr:hypothetical protein [Rhodoferax sp.]MDR3370896.1 hypothetical protein [Rhodoferax sp.]